MTSLRLGGVPEHFNLPWHLAIESDALSDLDLSWQDQPGGTGAMLSSLDEGELDMVSILTEGTVLAIDQGAPLTILQVYVQSPLRWGVHVPAASRFQAEDELDGARIAISRFRSGSHLMAFVFANRMGWGIDDDQFVVIGNLEGARESFAGAESDLFLWDRYMTQMLVDNGEFRRVGVQVTPWPSFVFAARDEVIESSGDELNRVIDEVVAQAVNLHSRSTVVEDLTARYDIDPATVQEWLNVTEFAPRGPVDDAMLAGTLATLRSAGFS